MQCADARLALLGYQRHVLDGEPERAVRAHLQACPACAREDVVEEALTDALEHRLPQYPASLALKRRLERQWPITPARPTSSWRRHRWGLLAALAVALVLLGAGLLSYRELRPAADAQAPAMVMEAVNDHVRILASQHPLEIEGSRMSEVRPWFEGRLDFAPIVPLAGDDEFRLQGAAVGYFLDRTAAVFVFHRGLHTITLLVFRADALPWPVRSVRLLGPVFVHATASRGFNVLLWRKGPLGYALVSDVEMSELARLAEKLVGT